MKAQVETLDHFQWDKVLTVFEKRVISQFLTNACTASSAQEFAELVGGLSQVLDVGMDVDTFGEAKICMTRLGTHYHVEYT